MAAAGWTPLAILLSLCLPVAAIAADAGPTPEERSPQLSPDPGTGCEGEAESGAEGIDTVRAGLQRGVCSTSRTAAPA